MSLGWFPGEMIQHLFTIDKTQEALIGKMIQHLFIVKVKQENLFGHDDI